MSKVKIVALSGCLSFLLTAGLVRAAEKSTNEKPAGTKIGYVYAQRILEETKAGKKIKKELDDIAKEKRTKLEMMKNELDKLEEDLNKKRLILSLDAKNKMEEELRQKEIDLKRYQEDSLLVLKRYEKEALKTINDTAMDIIKQIGEEEKYLLILELRESNVLYADPHVDLTDKVIEAYDKSEAKEKGKK
ncbi:MAG: OmpH family outer membrane protein [Candidatus Schekmanbacteria bacterium]|nr:OmpH family outer membrane protein [Candidatus Schekmanbacteria bacterium]